MSETTRLRVGLAGCQAGLEAMSFDEAMSTIASAEQTGLDGVWVNEEHLGGRVPTRTCWATLPFMSYLAARVPRIRLGSAALLLPLHHPLRLAEEIGSLCSFAPDRVALGVSPHRSGPYADAFGAPVHDSPDGFRADFDEYLSAVTALLRGEQIDLRTSGHRRRSITSAVVPETPPRWFRAAYSPESISAAARTGMPLLQHYIQSPTSISTGRARYRSIAGEAADELLRESPVHRFVLLGPDEASARRTARQFAAGLTARLRSFGIDQRGYITGTSDLATERFADETVIAGSADVVVDRLLALAAETGTGTVNVNLGWMGSVDREQVDISARLLIDEVLPRLSPSIDTQEEE